MSKGIKALIATGVIFFVVLFGALFFRSTFLTFVENYEFAYYYDYRTGKMDSLNRTGYFLTCPLVYSVHTIDKRPTQVTMNANNRVLNAKLVEFNTRGWRTFVAWHGRNDYSNESAGGSSPGNLNEILRSYAYDGNGRSYSFLNILKELKSSDASEYVEPKSSSYQTDTTKIQ